MAKSNWKTDFDEALDLNVLKEKFVPSEHYRISEFSYPAAVSFDGSMMAGKCFVLQGAVTYQFENYSVTLSANEWADLPGGPYKMSTDKNIDVKIVLVWKLPAH